MKKRILILIMFLLSFFTLASCGETVLPTPNNDTKQDDNINNNQGTDDNNQGNNQGTDDNNQGNNQGTDDNNQGTDDNKQGNNQGTDDNNQGNNDNNQDNNENKTTAKVDIYAFNDTHGNLKDTEGKGIGISKMSTLLDDLTKDKSALLVHQGDMWQGSIESNYTYGKFGTEWLKNQGFAAMTVGNHEFDWGPDKIIENKEAFDFPILGINVVDATTRQRVDYLDPSVVVERDGLKIGIIGAIGNCLSSISSSNVPGIAFATGTELTNLVKAESTRLRSEENCDFIVYSLHGSPSRDADETYDMSLSTDHYVDLVLEGHTHTSYSEKDSGGVYHVQANANNESFYQISLTYNFTDSTYTIAEPVEYDTRYTSPYINYTVDGDTDSLFTKYESYYLFAYEELGENEVYRSADTLKRKVSELYLEAGLKKWASNYQIILGGGYTSCRGSGLEAGTVIYAKLAELFPFNNDVVLCSVSGADLKNTSFINYHKDYYLTWSDYGNSIKDSIDDNTTYYLVTDTYNSDYNPNHLTVIDRLSTGGKFARDLLADYIKAGNYAGSGDVSGTVTNPKSVADALALAATHSGSTVSAAGGEYFYFTGKVCQKADQLGGSGDLRNVYIEDLNNPGTKIQIYYLSKNENRNPKFTSVDDLSIGDVIVIHGAPFTYTGSNNNLSIKEFASGAYCYSINGVLTSN